MKLGISFSSISIIAETELTYTNSQKERENKFSDVGKLKSDYNTIF